MIKKLILIISLFIIVILSSLFTVFSQLGCIDGEEIELWGECYNIETTTELDLSNSYPQNQFNDFPLKGKIPSDIGKLINLTFLDLSHHELTGEIPPEIGNLTKLIKLRLKGNQLTGEVPSEITNLKKLDQLFLWGNKLEGGIEWIGELPNLFQVYIDHNQFSGEIPSEIGNLKKLFQLDLSYNNLTGEIPSDIGNLTELLMLDLSYNQFTGSIPSEIEKLINLSDELSLNNNQFTSLPKSICNLPGYCNISLSNNNFCDEHKYDCIEDRSKKHYINIIYWKNQDCLN